MSQSQRFDSRYEAALPRPPVPGLRQSGRPPSVPVEVRSGPVVAHEPRVATLILIVGLPGAGKTTRAKELAATRPALRLTPDHWMIPLFGDSMADGKRFVLEGRLISVALQALRLGTSVVLDFGLWGRDERSALRWLAQSAGAACQVVLPLVDEVLLPRRSPRRAAAAHRRFLLMGAAVVEWWEKFRGPAAADPVGGGFPGRRGGWPAWPEWAVDHWPSCTDS